MQYNRLGASGLVVSKLTFGAGSLGVGNTLPTLKKNVDEKLSRDMVARALDAGITSFDCANVYVAGQSEIMLGKCLGTRRHEVIVTTKAGGVMPGGKRDWNQGGLSMKNIIQSCEDSLKRLGTDYVDIFYCHSFDRNTPLEETARAFEHLVRSGKARYIGVSNYPAWMASQIQTIQALNKYSPVLVNQVYYSLLGRLPERELVPLQRLTGIGIIGYEALAGGFLTGKYTREDPAPAGTRRATFTEAPRFELETGFKAVDLLKDISKRHNLTPARIALAYSMRHPWMNSSIFGVSKMEQLEDNLGAVDVKLPDEEWKKLDEISPPVKGFRI